MPSIYFETSDRRTFLRVLGLAGAGLALGGCTATGSRQAGGPELHLAMLSDTHVPEDKNEAYRGFTPWTNLQQVAQQVLQARPAAALLNGDAARLEGKPGDYAALRGLLQPIAEQLPVVIGLGNHDDRANFLKAFPETPGLHPEVAGHHVTVLEHPAVRIIQLDSLLYPNRTAGWLGRAQRAWLAGFLKAHGDRPAVLVVHHTLGDGDGELLDASQLFELARPHRHVQAIFYGHSHVWSLGRRDRLHLVNLPAVGYNFGDKEPVGWVEAWFSAQGVRLHLHAIGGNRSLDGTTAFLKWA